jgi:hypothetical protein
MEKEFLKDLLDEIEHVYADVFEEELSSEDK